MRIRATARLFAWEALEDSPSLAVVRRFLEIVPDGRLLESLRRHRGKGRDDYPVTALWGTVLLTSVLPSRHDRGDAGGAGPQRTVASADRHRDRGGRSECLERLAVPGGAGNRASPDAAAGGL